MMIAESENASDETNALAHIRLISLDALRGFDMFWITGGTGLVYSFFAWVWPAFGEFLDHQFEHVEWHGFVFYDLIFSLFIFIMGVSVPLSIAKRNERGDPTEQIYRHILTRTFLLLFIGFLYNNIGAWKLSDMRIFGVLIRIGICYFAVSLLCLWTTPKQQIIISGGILIGYWLLMRFVPVPGFGAGLYTPEGNLSGYIDRTLFGKTSFCCYEYGDSEGLLSTIPAIATGILGMLAGHLLRGNTDSSKKTLVLLGSGIICLGLALLWNLSFPINKYLWSSSFVLYSGGWSMLLLGGFYWIIDVKGWSRWAFFFIVIGMNAIFIYIYNGLISFGWVLSSDNLTLGALFAIRLLEVFLRWIIVYICYKKRLFVFERIAKFTECLFGQKSNKS